MDLVSHYLDAIRPLLPRGQRGDIADELAEAIHDRIDDKEAGLGRPLDPAEIEAILHEFGHPVIVAARYGPQRQLIGPTLFPIWWLGVRALAGITVAITLFRILLVLAYAPADAMVSQLLALWPFFWTLGLALVGAVTIAAAAAERVKPKWRVRNLVVLPSASRPAPRRHLRIAFAFSLAGLLFWLASPLIWRLAPAAFQPESWARKTGIEISMAWWILLYAGAVATAAAHSLLRLAWLRGGSREIVLARRLQAAVGLGLALWAFLAGRVFLVESAAADPHLAMTVEWVNAHIFWFCLLTALASLGYGAWAGWGFSFAADRPAGTRARAAS